MSVFQPLWWRVICYYRKSNLCFKMSQCHSFILCSDHLLVFTVSLNVILKVDTYIWYSNISVPLVKHLQRHNDKTDYRSINQKRALYPSEPCASITELPMSTYNMKWCYLFTVKQTLVWIWNWWNVLKEHKPGLLFKIIKAARSVTV